MTPTPTQLATEEHTTLSSALAARPLGCVSPCPQGSPQPQLRVVRVRQTMLSATCGFADPIFAASESQAAARWLSCSQAAPLCRSEHAVHCALAMLKPCRAKNCGCCSTTAAAGCPRLPRACSRCRRQPSQSWRSSKKTPAAASAERLPRCVAEQVAGRSRPQIGACKCRHITGRDAHQIAWYQFRH
jgi:hypothetical protein